MGKTGAAIQGALGIHGAPRGVGLIFEPTVDSVVGVLGTLASGNFFCPISPHDPLLRVMNYIEDAGLDLILTTRETLPESLREGLANSRVRFIEDLIDGDLDAPAPRPIDLDQICALLYTSGSTGFPKGVIHTDRSLLHMVMNKGNAQGVSPSAQVAGLSSYNFGGYYWNIFAALLFGGTLHLYDFYKQSFEDLSNWLIEKEISQVHWTPTTMRNFLDTIAEPISFPALRLVSLGGETVYPNDIHRFQSFIKPPTNLSTTGATLETWFYASVYFTHPFPQAIDHIPMGFPSSEAKISLRDEAGREVPPGKQGEITIRTESLSLGYWRRPEVNAEKYVGDNGQDPYFRSGDLGTFAPGGLLYHNGRMDFQVKIRGMRVELEEIEATILQHPGVREAVVVGHQRSGEEVELIAYIVPTDLSGVTPQAIQPYLRARLSPHQIPARTLLLESLPLTRTHKIDRAALPDPAEVPEQTIPNRVGPRTDTEARVHDIWVAILGHDRFGVRDLFIEVGGDSLQAMRVRNQIEAQLGTTIPLGEFLAIGTIEKLAELADNLRFSKSPHKEDM